jgi:nitrile hydratase
LIDELVDSVEHRVGPHLGARLVAKAWVDPEFGRRLVEEGAAAVDAALLGRWSHGARLVALQNSDSVHNAVVCTLCSCYPVELLGSSPPWFKSAPYRARMVMDPRGVLAEFGTEVSDETEVRVWDSNSNVRYLVIPQRPDGTEGWSEEDLIPLVTRNAMIGVERAKSPTASSERGSER